ncbi:Siderophore iron transporter mirB [Talaromyces atroroseus]|uniref:Siderophore iron transporter mirB n=1 Tax=Talaromyces atroroseus TaxID=1441469 RepID=A0A225AUV5_TALAT|nr:Siderophore iron transporter mirB [Talaromyces atroroseus]OKL59369.1 Siderophore iron transporter mirB [Talaromyces atroroseus]
MAESDIEVATDVVLSHPKTGAGLHAKAQPAQSQETSTFQVVSGVHLFIVGYLIRRTGRFKWTFYFSIPIYIFGLGLIIYFRRPNQNIGYLVMCEIFIAIDGSVFTILTQLAVLVAVDQQHVAAVIALLYVIGSVGDAIGGAVCGAIWTNTFTKALERYQPASALPNLARIYEVLLCSFLTPLEAASDLQSRKLWYAQTRMLAAGVGVFELAFI